MFHVEQGKYVVTISPHQHSVHNSYFREYKVEILRLIVVRIGFKINAISYNMNGFTMDMGD